MSGLEFIDALIGHVLSWPVIVLVIAVTFQEPIAERIRTIRSFKAGGVEVNFGDLIQSAEEKVRDFAGSTSQPPGSAADEMREADRVREAEAEPTSSVILAWTRLEDAQHRLATELGVAVDMRRPPAVVAKQLENAGVVNRQYTAAVTDLANARNLIVHGRHTPTPGEAASFVQTVEELSRFLALPQGRTRVREG